MKMKRNFLWILLAGLLLTGCAAENSNMGAPSPGQGVETNNVESSVEENEKAADNSETAEVYVLDFEATTLEGERITSECFGDSKLTMLNVWATYCGPCLNEMPDLGEIAASYDKAEFQMLGIISDVVAEDSDGMAHAAELITQTGANYPHIPLNQSLYSNLVGGVDSVPTTFFVNQKGELLGYVLGAQSKEAWEEIIHGLLEEVE